MGHVVIDIWAKMFYTIAKLPIIQSYYIHKYDMHCVIDGKWNLIYSGNEIILATGNSKWKHEAGMLGLSQNRLVVRLLTEKN